MLALFVLTLLVLPLLRAAPCQMSIPLSRLLATGSARTAAGAAAAMPNAARSSIPLSRLLAAGWARTAAGAAGAMPNAARSSMPLS